MPWLMIAKAGVLIVVAGVVFGVYSLVKNFIDEANENRERAVVAERVVAEKKAEINYLERAAVLEAEFQSKKAELIDETNKQLSDAREREVEAREVFTASRLEELSNRKQSEHSTVTVNERLTNRAAKAIRKKADSIEHLSRWDYSVSVQPVEGTSPANP